MSVLEPAKIWTHSPRAPRFACPDVTAKRATCGRTSAAFAFYRVIARHLHRRSHHVDVPRAQNRARVGCEHWIPRIWLTHGWLLSNLTVKDVRNMIDNLTNNDFKIVTIYIFMHNIHLFVQHEIYDTYYLRHNQQYHAIIHDMWVPISTLRSTTRQITFNLVSLPYSLLCFTRISSVHQLCWVSIQQSCNMTYIILLAAAASVPQIVVWCNRHWEI